MHSFVGPLLVFGILLTVIGLIVLLVPPASSATGLGDVVNLPGAMLKYTWAISLIAFGAVLLAGSVVIRAVGACAKWLSER